MSAAQANNQHWTVQPVDPPQLTDTQWYLSWLVAAILIIMAVSQLIAFTDFKSALSSYDLSGPSGWAVVIIIAELLAAIGFLKVRLSRAFRLFSLGLAVLVASFWFVESLQVFGNGNGLTVTNSGFFGNYLVQTASWWTALEAIIFLFLTVYAVELARVNSVATRVRVSEKPVAASRSRTATAKRASTRKTTTRRKRT